MGRGERFFGEISPDEITNSVKRGLDYLISQRRDGMWVEDFGLRHGPSDVWVTAYVGRQLNKIDPTLCRESAKRVLDTQRSNGGFAFNSNVEPDSDTTANAILFLEGVSFGSRYSESFLQNVIGRAKKFVLAHQTKSGGISAWTQGEVFKMGYEGSGWSSEHTCVSALAAQVLGDEAQYMARRFLLKRQLPDGSWPAYWWPGRLYSTFECTQLFGWADETIKYFNDVEPTCAFETAYKLAGLVRSRQPFSWCLQELLDYQLESGGFVNSPINYVPRPSVIGEDRLEGSEITYEKYGIFSTAAAVVALSMAADRLRERIQFPPKR